MKEKKRVSKYRIPKNKRRTIVVDNIEYEYTVKGKANSYVEVIVRNTTTGKIATWNNPDDFCNVKPSDVKKLIMNEELNSIYPSEWR